MTKPMNIEVGHCFFYIAKKFVLCPLVLIEAVQALLLEDALFYLAKKFIG